MTPLVLGLTLTAGVCAAEDKPAEKVVPQPRARLAPTPEVAVGQVEKTEKPVKPETEATVVLDRIFVRESKLPVAPLKALEPEPDKFSLLGGGPMFKGRIGSLPFAVGLWANDDLFKEDAKFRPQKTRVDVDFLRIKW